MKFNNSAEKAEYYKKRKQLEQNERKLACYAKNKETYNKLKKELRTSPKTLTRASSKVSPSAIRMRKYREAKRRKIENNRSYQSKYKTQQKCRMDSTNNPTFQFKHRMEKCRLLKKINACIPGTPNTKKSILRATSKDVPHVIEDTVNAKIISNMADVISTIKKKRSNDARAAMNVLAASVSGEDISGLRCKGKTAKKLGLRPWRVTGGYKKRATYITSEKSCFTHITRKVRSDRVSDETKRHVYNWWIAPQSSRPTGNKADIKRERTAYKTYLSHPIYILQKTQTEVFNEFKLAYPTITLSQRVFERLKPFFVKAMRTKDRNTCCCRKHVEARLLHRKCNEYLRNHGRENIAYTHLSDLVNATMCEKPQNTPYHTLKCIQMQCGECGVSKVEMFLDANMPNDDTNITWEKYEYVNVQLKTGSKRKLMMVKTSTTPREMFQYFRGLLQGFTQHKFSANWQLDQLSSLKQHLPENTCLTIHDFSENYKCIDRDELQSAYYAKTEVSIHVSVIYRHAVAEYDEIHENHIVTELMFAISPDVTHDHHFVKRVQHEIKNHLSKIGCLVDRMVEFTDGCSSQYKSKTCMGMSTFVCEQVGYREFQRNYFETSHAKGPQDAAGGLLKRQLDLAVMKGNLIQNAEDVYAYCLENLQTPKSGIYQRRNFVFPSDIDRTSNITFRPIPQNRKVHQLRNDHQGRIQVRHQSCYTCDNCIIGEDPCENLNMTGDLYEMDVLLPGPTVHEAEETDADVDDTTLADMISCGDVVAVVADDDVDDYYVLKLTEAPHTLDRDVNDDWGNTFPANSSVVSGLYYTCMKKPQQTEVHTYKLIKSRKAIVFTSVVCSLLKRACRGTRLEINDDEHINITSAVERLKYDYF